jgi:succinoglycan biosynthesis protein ExoL
MKIIFLLPVAAAALFYRRIKALERLGISPKVLAFERDYYPGKFNPDQYEVLGHLRHQHYYKRLLAIMRAIPKVRAAVANADVIYAFGLDMLLLGWIASRTINKPLKLVYEVVDVREVLLGENLISRSLRCLERFLLQRTKLLVVTTQAYVSEYYQKIQGLKNLHYHEIENKLPDNELPPFNSLAQKKFDGVLRIGYFGCIRCRRSWEILKKLAERAKGRILVYVRGFIGVGMKDVEKELPLLSYINYGGPYISPDDLPEIYAQVDMIWACSTYSEGKSSDWKWSRAHRFYEACYFGKPVFTAAGTEDARVSEPLGIGTSLDLHDVEGSVDRILRIDNRELIIWKKNIDKLPQAMYMYTDEHEKLITEIQGISKYE